MNFFQKVYEVTRQIPRGRVASYGLIASLSGSPRAARQVGWALHQLDHNPRLLKTVPWHRVVNSKGYISTTCTIHTANMQKVLLESEGIRVVRRDNLWWLDLKEYLWQNRKSKSEAR